MVDMFLGQLNDRLHMMRMRKHVKGLHGCEAVRVVCGQSLYVAGKGCRIAGNVYNAPSSSSLLVSIARILILFHMDDATLFKSHGG